MNKRRVELEGAVNFRDLGGYPTVGGRTTRWRTMYRSDSLADLTVQRSIPRRCPYCRTWIDTQQRRE